MTRADLYAVSDRSVGVTRPIPLPATPYALIVTGTCGSGKTTVSTLLANRDGWTRVSEDDIWREYFGKNRGSFGSEEHRRKRQGVHAAVFAACRAALEAGQSIVIDATVHEAPAEAYNGYRDFFDAHGIAWKLRVVHPKLAVAVARDASRSTGRLGADRVASLRAKFTKAVFAADCFVDSSEETPEQTVTRLLARRTKPCSPLLVVDSLG